MEEDIKNNSFVYFNDEWNGIWLKDPKKDIEIKEIDKSFKWFNIEHWLFEMYYTGKISKQELELKLKNI